MLYLPKLLVKRSTFEAQPGLNLISMSVLKLAMKYSNKLQFVEASPRETTIESRFTGRHLLSFATIFVIQTRLN
jgi:hypothetical protein